MKDKWVSQNDSCVRKNHIEPLLYLKEIAMRPGGKIIDRGFDAKTNSVWTLYENGYLHTAFRCSLASIIV